MSIFIPQTLTAIHVI